MASYFYYYDNDKKRGPYTAQEMKERVGAGVIKPNTIIDVNGMRYRADRMNGLLSSGNKNLSDEDKSSTSLDFSGIIVKDEEEFVGLMNKHPIANFFGKFNGLIVALLDVVLIGALIWFLKDFDLSRFGLTKDKVIFAVKIVIGVLGSSIIMGLLYKEKQFVDRLVQRIKSNVSQVKKTGR